MVRIIHKRKRTIFLASLFAINPMSSVIFGTPLPFPFPAIPEPSPGLIAIMNIASLCTTLFGGIVGVAFWLDKRSKSELTKLDVKIDKNTLDLKSSIEKLGESLCASIRSKNEDTEKNTDFKVNKAKEIVDERFKHMDERFRHHKERIDRLDSMSMFPNRRSNKMAVNNDEYNKEEEG